MVDKKDKTVTIEMMGATEPIEITEKEDSQVQRTGMGRVYVKPEKEEE